MWARRLVGRLLFPFRRERFDRELAEEIELHRAMLERDQAAQGRWQEEAAADARRRLGNVLLAREQSREVWVVAWLGELLADLRYATRMIAANRTFSALAILSLALGIGANTAIYSFVDKLLLRPLPVPDPASLVLNRWHARATGPDDDSVMQEESGTTYDDPSGTTGGIFPYPAFELFRRHDSLFSTVFARFPSWQLRNVTLLVRGEAGTGSGEFVSADYFRGLGVLPAAGRLIVPDDDRPGAPPVAVVSHAFAEQRFGAAASAAAQTLLIDNLPFTVVGVTPPGFFGVDPAAAPDVFLPMHTNELLGAGHPFGFRPESYLAPNYYWVEVIARLRPGVSPAQAQAALAPQFRRWVAATASNDRQRANLPELAVEGGSAGVDSLRRQYSRPLLVLTTLVALILLLACANVANLLLARAAARGRELALRMALGAGRLRIVRQMLTESVLLSSLGGVAGLHFAFWGIRLLTLLLDDGGEGFTLHAELDGHVLAAAAALSLLTGVLFGLAPALHAARAGALPALRAARGSVPEAARAMGRVGVSRLLTVSQIAISLVMLVAAGLFVRTLANLHAVALGFDRENLLLFELDARKAGHRDPEVVAFYGELRRRFAAIPGVRDASLSKEALFRGESRRPISLPGSPPDPETRYLTVGPTFFRTMRIPIVAGREIGERDRPGSTPVAVVNEVFARKNFGQDSPVGRHLLLWDVNQKDRVSRDMEIVGVSGDARYGGLRRAIPPLVYLPYDQGGLPPPNEALVYALRTAGDPSRYVSAVREMVREADPRLPVSEVRSQAADVERTISRETTLARLCSGFAALALVIACVGLYGTVSYGVSRRTAEIGIRVALGAQPGGVLRMILREVLALAGWGLAIGTAIALGTSRFVASLLYDTRANDPVTLTLAAVGLVTAALLAGYAPARRAASIDPVAALRQE